MEPARRSASSTARIYLGWNPSSPAIGDYRISYEVAPLGVISVIGQQQGERFQAYQTIAGDQLLMVRHRQRACRQMFKEAADANRLITWMIRGVGLLLLAIGFGLFMSPLAVIADFIPPLGSVVRMGTGLVAFLLAIVVGTITIAIAWFYYRPLLAIGILVVGAVVAAGYHLYRAFAAASAARSGAGRAGLTGVTARRRTPRSRLRRAAKAAGSRGASRRR